MSPKSCADCSHIMRLCGGAAAAYCRTSRRPGVIEDSAISSRILVDIADRSVLLGQIETNYDEVTDSFDAMKLKQDLLRGKHRIW